jgi:CheY-like chemotaxis protein
MDGENGITAMVVDDDDADRCFLTRSFRRCEPNGLVKESATAATAMRELAAAEHPPEVAFIDLRLPDVPGVLLVTWMRQRRRFDSTVVVAVTGDIHTAHAARPSDAGADAVLLKPIDDDALAAVLHVVRCGRKRSDA